MSTLKMIPSILELNLSAATLDLAGFERMLRGHWMDRMTEWPMLLAILTGLIATILVWLYMRALDRDRAQDGPLFRQLARQASLTAMDRRIVWQIARAAEIDQPAALLVSEGYFDHALRAAGHAIPAPQQTRIALIRQQLFAST